MIVLAAWASPLACGQSCLITRASVLAHATRSRRYAKHVRADRALRLESIGITGLMQLSRAGGRVGRFRLDHNILNPIYLYLIRSVVEIAVSRPVRA